MDHIDIPEDQILPMDAIAPGIVGLRIMFVNVFGIINADGSWVLVDTGVPFSETRIRSWAEETFPGTPAAILLTHGHFDHAGCAKALADHWNVPVYGHPAEKPYLSGEKEYPKPNFAAGGGMMSLLSPLLPRGPFDLADRLRLLNGESIPELPDWQIVHTPGHTPGHVSIFRPDDQALLAGDAFCTTKPESFFEANIAQSPELHGPPAYFTSDWNAARRSVQLLAELKPRFVAPGHGKPMRGANVPAMLSEMAVRFREIAVPENRRDSAA
jgi:glyoxylase-like metal-dependent hydrolase (beta-lactamase superfamily II)